MSDEITIIRDGKIVDTVETSQTDEGSLARRMVGRDVLLRVEKKTGPGGWAAPGGGGPWPSGPTPEMLRSRT